MQFPVLPSRLILALEGASLTPAPEVLLRLMRAVEDEGASLQDIAAIVDKDPAIAARVLAAANSTAFHRRQAVTSLEQCLQVLGLRVVRSIAVCLSVQCVFAQQTEGARIDLARFWYHSLLAAELARSLADALAYARPGEAYLGGLLHDIGELALLSALRGEYAALLEQGQDEISLTALEAARLGATHAEVGAWLVDQWQLDSLLADSVLFHHATARQIVEADMLARIVWSAHQLTAVNADANAPALAEVALVLSLPEATLMSMHAQVETRVATLAEAMGIALPEPAASDLLTAQYATGGANAAAVGLLESMAETAILQALQNDLQTPQRTAVLPALAESSRILLGAGGVAFFAIQAAEDALVSVGDVSPALAEVRMVMTTSNSLAVRALRERQVMATQTSGHQATALIDIQMARSLRSEGLLCLPLLRGGQPLGVMVMGMSAPLQARLLARPSWLMSFARIAAMGLETAQRDMPADDTRIAHALGREQQIRRFSHEVGNPLSIIKTYLRLLETKVPSESDMRDELLVLKEEIERVVRIVRQLSEPATTHQPLVDIDLNRVVNDLLTLYSDSLFGSRGITLTLSLDPRQPVAHGDRDGIKQILLNLLKNASEALPSGGQIEIETSAAMLDAGVRYVGFTVRDNGPGIPLSVVQRLYAPMVEQALVPGARGIGLNIVGGLVRHMHGKVVCETREGHGSRIIILLPLPGAEAGQQRES